MISVRTLAAASVLASVVALEPAQGHDTVILSSVGSASANGWPTYVAIEKGLFAVEGLTPDIVYAQSNAAVIQQLAAGSVNVSTNSGLVDPIRATEKGAPLALVRVEMQAPPYSLLAKPSIKSIGDLKGKLVSVGGAKDITRIFVERMLRAQRREAGRLRHDVCGRDLGALCRPASRCGRCRNSDAAVQFPRPDRGASTVSAMPSITPICRSPAWR